MAFSEDFTIMAEGTMTSASVSPRSICVAVMCFNEAASLPVVVAEITDELQRLGGDYEVVIINDGSTDGSGEIADSLAKESAHIRVIHHPRNLGLGAVYRNAFLCGTKELTTVFPADGQFAPEIIGQFARLFDDMDLVLGYIPEFRKNRSFAARTFSWAERCLYRLLFGRFPDFQGIMMFRRELVDTIELSSSGRGWMIQMELILRFIRKGYRVISEPTGIRARMSGESKVMNLSAIASNLRQVFALRWNLWRHPG
ncbi:MAG TPA: glycosyltransferase family 2 protein [Kiritimatiellia bacterium]|jgi:glycosyltransferase involved in cell wall biosynthesis|nr:glycosyltransferase family 2 protein [Kiritimatiellia bacterium]HQF20990.1 glycosyltransferase family 2 protein [Kiritimatiellia bacterium]HQG75103.1 glycosyltransferase family 2 protein [Kiritimatiellia bacterium]HQM23210.1 glycosyltransferase family 2 protein [Kiritimatiellia bacterium]